MPKAEECVKVVVRIRPISSKEKQDGREVTVTANEGRGDIIVRNPKLDDREEPKTFTFDAVFGPNCTQKSVYDTCGSPVVESVLNGYNGTIFAYGQTGSGKTHTMEGVPDRVEMRGIIPNSFKHIFDRVAISENQQFLVRASYLEIYNEEIRDLLSRDPKNRLELKENPESGVYVKDLTSFVVKSAGEIDNVMQAGKKNRSVGATLMNQSSSRSHSIFTIIVECCEIGGDKGSIRVGKLNLVDLAGSERQAKTGATGDRLKEATKINLSLSALGNVISALVDARSSHIPYRDSKLTRLLQDSLGGNTKTVMCANCGPADYNYDETLSTLRYANRAKNIKNKPRINEDPKDAMLREFQEEIQRLKEQLAQQEKGMMVVDGKEVPISYHGGESKEETKVVEKVVEKIVEKDISKEKLQEMELKAQREKEELQEQARKDMERALLKETKSQEEREKLKARLKKEAEARKSMANEKAALFEKLQAMQAKLVQGGEMLDKAAEQEAILRKTKAEMEEKEREQQRLAREIADREESHLVLEEQYSNLQEEVDVKTKKLKKLVTKYKAMETEVNDLQEEFQRERDDFLEAIRELTREMKLKDQIISHFIPPEETRRIEARAHWNEENDNWTISKLELNGNALLPRRPISSLMSRRPESEFSKNKKTYDKNPRYRVDNIASLDIEKAEVTTQSYLSHEPSNVASVLNATFDVNFGNENSIPNPYISYNDPDVSEMHRERVLQSGEDKDQKRDGKGQRREKERETRPKSSKRSSSKNSKKYSTRRSSVSSEEEKLQEERDRLVAGDEIYPTARGLVTK